MVEITLYEGQSTIACNTTCKLISATRFIPRGTFDIILPWGENFKHIFYLNEKEVFYNNQDWISILVTSTGNGEYIIATIECGVNEIVDPKPEPNIEVPNMNCQDSSVINAGEIWNTYYADIRVIDVYDTNSGRIGIKPMGKYETIYNVSENQITNTETEDFNLTVKPYVIFIGSDGTKAMQFTLCWEPKYVPPVMCTHTFKLQDQNGNPLNGNVNVGTTNITVIGTGTVSLEKDKSYIAKASFSDLPIQSKTFTACTTTTFVFTIVSTVGTLSVTSSPASASIRIDGTFYGLTPKEGIELPLGVHNVILTLAGYHDVTKEVTLQAGIPGIISETLTMLEPEPEPEPDPGGYIGTISHEFTGDEIKIFVPVTNIWTKETCFYVDLRDQSGAFIEKAPMLLQSVKLAPGESGTITIDSYGAINPSWNVTDVQGQTLSLELKGIASIIGVCSIPPIGYTIVHTKSYDIPIPPDPDPDPDDPPVYVTGTIGTITKEIIQQMGNDEVKFSIPVTNNTSKEQCYIVKMYNEAGDYIAKTPTSIVPGQMANKIVAGGTETMILNSDGQFWHINDIQGQTITFKLYGDPSFLTTCPYLDSGYSMVDSKVFVMETYIDPDKDVFDPGDLLGVNPLLEVPIVNVNKVVFKGLGNPNETIYIYQDQSFELDDLITSFECGPDGKYSGEHDFNTGSYKLYAKKSGALGKESERHNVLVIDVIHLVLLLMALGLTIWKIRRK